MAADPSTASAFFYGTLMSPAILARVTGRADLSARPALLHAHRRHRVAGADYPAVVPVAEGDGAKSSVRGTLVAGLRASDMRRLDVFEGDEYDRVRVGVRLLPSAAAGDAGGVLPPPAKMDDEQGLEIECQTYVWRAPREQLEEREWDFDEFVREKMWRWVPGGEGERQGEYDDLDKDVAAEHDSTRGRAVGGGFEQAVAER